jgi:hypothetical protein
MLKLIFAALLATLLGSNALAQKANEDDAWIDNDHPANILESRAAEQARQVAICASSFRIAGEIFKKDGFASTGETMNGLYVGAKTSIIGLFVMEFAQDIEKYSESDLGERFQKVREYGVMASETYPEVSLKEILSRLELGSQEQWIKQMQKTVVICSTKEALTFQQVHIDAVRSLAFGIK